MYNGIMSYVPRTKIWQTVTVQENRFIRDAVDRGNMKLASIAKNIITEYGFHPMRYALPPFPPMHREVIFFPS